jgi:hypothetical protein
MGPSPTFTAPLNGRLRRLGLAGKTVTLSLGDDELVLADDQGGIIGLFFTRIEKVRVGFTESKSGTYLFTRIWLAGEGKPVVLWGQHARQAYGDFVWALVRALFERKASTVVETGDGPFTPVFLITAFGAMWLASVLATARQLVIGDDWYTFIGPLVITTVLLATLGPWTMLRYWPRRIHRVEDLRRAIPGYRSPLLSALPRNS